MKSDMTRVLVESTIRRTLKAMQEEEEAIEAAVAALG